MDKQHAAHLIVEHALPIVPFEGWNLQTLEKAAASAGYRAEDVARVFPGGTIDAVDHFSAMGDARMLEQLADYSLETMRVPARIALAIRLSITAYEPHREAVRKAIAFHAMPFYAARGLQCLYNTVDEIWRAIGDTSTDFNFYTKRLSLAAVYSSTMLYWLDDQSDERAESWAFLERRLADVALFGKTKKKLFGG